MHPNLVLPSTLFLTLLLMVGLFFFVKAAVKDRTQQERFGSPASEEELIPILQSYFSQRAYRVTGLDRQQQQIVFEGMVRPSLFLGILLTLLVVIGLFCLGLVLSILLPQWGSGCLAVVLLTPIAPIFYWTQAKRQEKVLLRVESLEPSTSPNPSQSLLTVTAHRDELRQLQTALKLQPLD